MDPQTEHTTGARRRVGLARGEAPVAAVGAAMAAVVLGVLAASAWLTLRTYRQSLVRAREEQVGVVVSLLSQGVEVALSGGELNETLSGVRSMVAGAGRDHGLRECRLVLSDGTVLADLDAGQLSRAWPESWPALKSEAMPPHRAGDGLVAASGVVRVPSHGEAMLEVSADVAYPAWADGEVQAGIGIIGAGGMAGLWGLYRSVRRRWRALGAVGDALRESESGGVGRGALTVRDELGAEARAWNKLVRERDALRDEAAVVRAAEQVAGRRAGGAELAGALDALPHGVVVVNGSGVVAYANAAGGVLLGSRGEALLGQAAGAVFADEKVREAVASGGRGRVSVEMTHESAGGERTVVRATVRSIRGEQGGSVVLLEDVTQQRAADDSRNAFVAQATHELRTPLTNIRLYVETLVEEGEDAGVRAKCLNVISTESRRLERIVGDMLSVAEIEAGALRLNAGEVRTDTMFEELAADFAAAAEDKAIALAFEAAPKMPVMQADRDKLMLALHNLIGNALKYTPAGGRVGVRVRAEGGEFRVDVTDTGIGIKPEEHELVFERFYRAKDKRINGITGSGIGLALARQVVRLHGGDITVASEIDKGSTFTLSVPIVGAGGLKAAA